MIHHILQVIYFQLAFLLAYDFLLKKETFFSYNRWYLLITPLLSLLLPFLQFDVLTEMAPVGSAIVLPEVIIGVSPHEAVSVGAKAVESGLQINWWWMAYFCGFLINFVLFFRKYRMLKNLNRNAVIYEEEKWKIVEVPSSNIACTFYRTIFLGDRLSETAKQQVLAHELVHVRQKHTLDLLFFELQKIIFWFNPLVYIFQAKITDLHEFIADAHAVKTTEKKEYYQQLLNTAFSTQNISFINQFFNHSLIKKRIVMLQKSKSKTVSKLKFLVIIPLMLAMLLYVSCAKEATPIAKDVGEPETVPIAEVVLGSNSDTSQEKAPAFHFTAIGEDFGSGCDNLPSNEAKKACITEKIRNFVDLNFDTSLTQNLGLTGINRIYLQFRINKNGVAEVIGVRAPHAALEEETKRVINSLPKVAVDNYVQNVDERYTLAITFMIADKNNS